MQIDKISNNRATLKYSPKRMDSLAPSKQVQKKIKALR